MDHISGGLSMEYFDKLTAMGEKLREDWNTTNDRYVERRSVWRVCDQEMRSFAALEHELNNWLVDIEQFIKDIKKVNVFFKVILAAIKLLYSFMFSYLVQENL